MRGHLPPPAIVFHFSKKCSAAYTTCARNPGGFGNCGSYTALGNGTCTIVDTVAGSPYQFRFAVGGVAYGGPWSRSYNGGNWWCNTNANPTLPSTTIQFANQGTGLATYGWIYN